ncbi:MAG: Ig-like domain-containing protein [Idiomarina sp.]
MNPIYKALLLSGFVAVSGTLVGCGGSDDPTPPPPPPPNTAPEAADDAATVQAGATITIDVLDNDGDADGDAITVSAVAEPENGTAAIAADNAGVDYTPADGFLGEDTFTYTISDGEDTATATVTVTVQETVTVTGRVIDAPIADAVVTVAVGDETFTATADAEGNYSVTINYTNAAQLLTINAQGAAANDQAYVNLTSTLPSLATLQAASGGDGVLDRSEAAGTNVTNVTTAASVLGTSALGAAPTTEEELEAAQGAVNPATLLELAAVIKLIIDNPDYDLPAGSTDIIAFASNLEAYNTYVEEVEAAAPGLLASIVDEIIADEELVQVETGGPPSYYVDISPTRPGFIPKANTGYIFNENGTGEVFSSFFTEEGNNTTMSWTQNDAGFYNLVFDAPVLTNNFPSIYDITDDATLIAAYEGAGITQATATRSQSGIRFKVISGGTRNDAVQIEETIIESYAPFTYNGQEYQVPPNTLELDYQSVFINGDKAEYWEIDAADVVGTWSLPILGQARPGDQNRVLSADLVTFAENGTFSALNTGLTGSWTLTDIDIVELSYGDVNQAVEVIAEQGALYGGLVVAGTDSGSIVATFEWIAKQNPEFAFTTDDVLTAATENWFAYINSWPVSGWDAVNNEPTIGGYFGWQFENSTTGYNISLGCEEFATLGYCSYTETTQLLFTNATSWSIAAETGALEIDRSGPCSAQQLPVDCRTRIWHPLDVETGDTNTGFVYVLELEDANFNPEGTGDRFTWVTPRLNILEKRTLPNDLSNPDYADTASATSFGYASSKPAAELQRVSFLPRRPANAPVQ